MPPRRLPSTLPTPWDAARIALACAFVSGLGVLLTERAGPPYLLETFTGAPALSKGWFFVGGTAVLLGLMLERSFKVIRQAGRKLLEEQERLQLALEAAGEEIWELSFEERTDPAAVMSSWKARVHPDDWPRVEQALRDHLEGSTAAFVSEHRQAGPDGAYRWVSCRSRLVRARQEPGPLRFVGTISEMSGRALAERRHPLEDELERLGSLLPGMVYTFRRSPDGQYSIPFSAGSLRDLVITAPGETLQDLSPWVAMVLPEDRAGYFESIAASEATLSPWHHRFRIRTMQGVRWLEGRSNPQREPDGSIVWHGLIQDVTERREAEEALYRSEARLRLALHAGNQGIFDLCLKTLDLEVSAEYARLLGFEPRDFRENVGDLIERVHPEDRARAAASLIDHFEGRTPEHRAELRLARADGTWQSVLSVGQIVERDEAGDAVRMLGTITDISPLVRTKAALAEEARARRMLLEQSVDGIAMLDEDGKIVETNPSYERMLGYEKEELAELYVWDVDAHLSKAELLERMGRLDARGDLLETRVRRKDGSLIDVEMSGSLALVAGRKRFLCVVRDVTARKRSEEALRRSEAEFRALFELASIGMAQVDLETRRSVRVNKRISAIAGRTAPELLELGLADLTHPEDRARVSEALTEVGKGEVPEAHLEVRWLRGDGSLAWVQVHLALVREENERPSQLIASVEDITERKRLEREVDRVGRAIETSPTGFALIGPSLELAYTNAAYREMWGFASAEEAAATPLAQHVADPDYAHERLERLRERGSLTVELEARRKDGSRFDVLVYAHHGRDDLGRNIYHAFIVDVSDRRRAERIGHVQHDLALRLAACSQLDEGLALCLDAALEAASVDCGGVYLWNEQALCLEMMTHRGLSEAFVEVSSRFDFDSPQARYVLLGEPTFAFYDALHPDPPEAVQGEALRFIAIIPFVHEKRLVGCLTVASHERDDLSAMEREALETIAAKASHAIVRLEAERARRTSETRFRTLVEGAPMGLLLVEEGVVAYANRACRDMLDPSGGTSVIGGRALERFHPSSRAIVAAFLEGAGPDSRPVSATQVVCLRQGGEDFEAELTAVPISSASKTGTLMFLQDITERRRLEAQLRQAQKLEAVGQLAGGVAHDFNNILASMTIHLDLLREVDDLPEEVRLELQEIEADVRRAASLTRQLVMFSRRSVLSVKPLDVNEVVRGLLKMLRRLIPESIELELVAHPGLPAVEADSGLLEQSVMNLVVNARDALPAGGTIRIATSSRQVGGEMDGRSLGKYVLIEVTDNGLGMTPEVAKRVFEPFFTTKEPGQGSGLGLATVHGIVAQHGGWVEVESAPGRGSRFGLWLPSSERSVEPLEEEPRALQVVLGQEKILVVEDEARVRAVMVRSLRSMGYQVFEASNAREALSLWEKINGELDLLVTDMVMPGGMSGLELAETLRRRRPDLPVVIASGYSAEMVGAGRLASPGLIYLQKPFGQSALARVVRQALDNF